MPPTVRFGTMGWSDVSASPAFKALANERDPLLAQAHLFSCVEVNSSHHQLPRQDVVQRWVDATPQQYVFHFKLFKQLVPPANAGVGGGLHPLPTLPTPGSVQDLWARFLSGVAVVPATRRGLIVVQLPLGHVPSPNAHVNLQQVAILCDAHGWRCAFEFRDRRWFADINNLTQWMTPLQSVLILVEELEHELYSNNNTSSKSMPLSLHQTNPDTIYVRIHRRQGQEQQRVLSVAAVQSLTSTLELKSLPSTTKIWILLGTDYKDAAVQNMRLISQHLSPRFATYPWPPPRPKTTLERFLQASSVASSSSSSVAVATATATTTATPTTTRPPRIICHLDLDSFYCGVECALRASRGDMSLSGDTPFVVSQYFGTSLVSVNSVAKSRGVKRGMSLMEAQKACPELVTVRVAELHGKADLTPYREYSERVMEIVHRHCSVIERASIDEMYLDLTSVIGQQEEEQQEDWTSLLPTTVACTAWKVKSPLQPVAHSPAIIPLLHGAVLMERIRAEIQSELHVTASAGVATSKFLAKMVSSLNKPNGQALVPPEPACIASLLKSTPLQDAIGFRGKFGEDLAERYGVSHLGDLVELGEAKLCRDLGAKTGRELFLLASEGDTGDDMVVARTKAKSIGCSKTFRGAKALIELADIDKWLGELAKEIVERWEKDKRRPTNVTVGIWGRGSRTMQVAMPIVDMDVLMSISRTLMKRLLEGEAPLRVESLSLMLSGFPNEDENDDVATSSSLMMEWLKKGSGGGTGKCGGGDGDDDDEVEWVPTSKATMITPPPDVNSVSVVGSSGWSCMQCTFINSGMRLRCEVCSADKFGDRSDGEEISTSRKRPSRAVASSSSSSVATMDKWLKVSPR